ncbi:MAG TPA: hypothetical protein VGD95_05330 [Micavibrio sp.]
MQKDDPFSFYDYSDPAWPQAEGLSLVQSFVPDEILAPVLTALQQRAGQILPHAPAAQFLAEAACPKTAWDWDRTLAFNRAVWADLQPRYGAAIDRLVAHDRFQHEDVAYGLGCGFTYRDSKVEILTTGTIDDPVCIVHESGHLLADVGPDFTPEGAAGSKVVVNVAEVQAMFAQEHAYHLLQQQEDPHVVAAHRLHYYLGTLQTIPVFLWQMQKPGAEEPLSHTFKKWSMSGGGVTDALFTMAEPQGLHLHPFAALVAPVLYKLYQEAAPAQKHDMLAALYERGDDVNLPEVLSVFGVRSPSDVAAVGTLAAAHLAEDVRQNITGAPAVPPSFSSSAKSSFKPF